MNVLQHQLRTLLVTRPWGEWSYSGNSPMSWPRVATPHATSSNYRSRQGHSTAWSGHWCARWREGRSAGTQPKSVRLHEGGGNGITGCHSLTIWCKNDSKELLWSIEVHALSLSHSQLRLAWWGTTGHGMQDKQGCAEHESMARAEPL